MSGIKWLVMADWDGDGRFAGAHDDITGVALDLSLTHKRDLASDHIGAAKLSLRLRNADHRFSPPNAASPLRGKLKPGRDIWLRAAFPCDEFEGAAGSALAASVPRYGAAYRWQALAGAFRVNAARTGAETAGGAAGRRIATMDLGYADGSFGCWLTRGGSANLGGLALRCADGANYLSVRFGGDAVEVRRTQAGVDATLASAALAWAVGQRHFVMVELHGESVRVFVDGRQVAAAQTAFNRAATRHGLYADGAANHLWQRFGGWASLFRGSIDAIDPDPRAAAQVCGISASDEMRRLKSVTLYMYAGSPLPQTADEILGDILDYAGADRATRRLDTGAELVPAPWSPPLWGARALDEIHRLQDEEDGFIYIDGNGYWRLEGRDRRESAPHATARATLEAQSGGRNPYFARLDWSDGADAIENKIFVRIREATSHGYQTAWTLSETLHFKAGETRDFLAESKDYDIVSGQILPVAGVDYAANTRADGAGDDLTRQIAVTHPAIGLYSGKGTLIRVKFGAAAGYLTRLALRSFAAYTYNAPVLVAAEDAASMREYGTRIHSIDARWTRRAADAQLAAERRLRRKKSPRSAIAATLPNGSDANALLITQSRLSDRIAVRYGAMGVNADFFVEGHRLEARGGLARAERTLWLRET